MSWFAEQNLFMRAGFRKVGLYVCDVVVEERVKGMAPWYRDIGISDVTLTSSLEHRQMDVVRG